MQDIWKHGESSVGEVLERLNSGTARQLAYNTVMSVMARLADKGILERERDGRAFRYRAAFDKSGFVRVQAAQAARELFEAYGDVGLAGIVDEINEQPRLRQQLDELLADED